MWCELHEIAFRRLGGTPRVVVLDNLKAGVLAPDIYDPELNPVYVTVRASMGGLGSAFVTSRADGPTTYP